jgi:hypothetical protein
MLTAQRLSGMGFFFRKDGSPSAIADHDAT